MTGDFPNFKGPAAGAGNVAPAVAVAAVLPPGPAAVPVAVNLPDFFAALGSPVRWAMVRLLADGREWMATWFAKELRMGLNNTGKHLRVLRAAGVVRSRRPEEDLRVEYFYIPESCRQTPGVLDWGFVKLDLTVLPPAAAPGR